MKTNRIKITDKQSYSAMYTPAQEAFINQMIAAGHCNAFYMADEPVAADLPTVGQRTQWMKQNHPDLLAYVGEGGGHTIAFYQSVVDNIHPDLLMMDAYPFHAPPYDTGVNDPNWLQYVMNTRQVALANHIPYGGWLQAFVQPGVQLRTPSESDTRYNAFTELTAGYTMLNYFMYDNGAGGATTTTTFFDANGNPTPTYTYTATANAEYIKVGQSLRFLTSTDVRFVPGKDTLSGPSHSTPAGLTNWASGAGGDPHLLNVTVDTTLLTNVGTEKNGEIGSFTDDSSNHYFMLTNLNHDGSLNAAQASLPFILTFDSSVNDIWLLNRTTGLSQEIALTNHVLNWTLPGGTGDLFKYDNGLFAGVTPLLGDLNQDGHVNAADIQVLESALTNPEAYEATYNMSAANLTSLADVNHDGNVNNADVQSLLNLLKTGGGSTNSVPEPMSIGLLGFGLFWLVSYLYSRETSIALAPRAVWRKIYSGKVGHL